MYRKGLKRLLDAALAASGLFLFALPMAWFAWQIRRQAGSPVLFRQTRIGYGGKPFTLLKFRTLDGAGAVALPLGRWLRATAMDELPQIANILRGEMSFVGPRPLIPEELRDLDQIPGGRRRFEVRPGLAGLAQIRGEKMPLLAQRVEWDLAYADRCSLWMDLKILFRSVAVTLAGNWEGARAKSHGL